MPTIDELLAAREVREEEPKGLLRPGDVVDGWRVAAFVGRGRSAEVYRVINTKLGGEGALKLLVDESKGLGERFTLETDVLRSVALAALPRYFGSGRIETGAAAGRRYLVMEYLQPLLLPLEPEKIRDFIHSLAVGVFALHSRGFLHRDLKPANILLRQDGTPVIIDLGLVKRMSLDAPDGAEPRGEISIIDGKPVGLGTRGFAAPEQLLEGRSSVAGDVYSLGAILRAAFGLKPPAKWSAVIAKATAAAPEDRYQSAQEFELAAMLAGRKSRPYDIVLEVVVGATWVVLLIAMLHFACCSRADAPVPAAPVDPAATNAAREVVAENAAASRPTEPLERRPGESEEAFLSRILPLAEAGDAEAENLAAEAYFNGRGTPVNLNAAAELYARAAAKGRVGAQAAYGLCLLRGWGCEKNADEAASWFLKAANGGNLGAMNDLAFCFMHGIGVDKDQTEGFQWAMKAAESGHPGAQTMVGECYLKGYGVEPDQRRSDLWLMRAARQGNARAKELLRAAETAAQHNNEEE